MSGIVGDRNLRAFIYDYKLVDPIGEDAIQPNSIDIRLGQYLRYSQVPENFIYDIRKPHTDGIDYVTHDLVERELLLMPKRFVLGVTLEFINIPSFLSATVEGKSSIGRMGLFVVNAGRVDSGWEGKLTLEIFNAEEFPIQLFMGMPIAQLVFAWTSEVEKPYGHLLRNNHYQYDTMPEPSRLWRDYPK